MISHRSTARTAGTVIHRNTNKRHAKQYPADPDPAVVLSAILPEYLFAPERNREKKEEEHRKGQAKGEAAPIDIQGPSRQFSHNITGNETRCGLCFPFAAEPHFVLRAIAYAARGISPDERQIK